jgi:hypothetical protein
MLNALGPTYAPKSAADAAAAAAARSKQAVSQPHPLAAAA